MSYELLRTDTFDEQLRDIAFYLRSVSGSAAAALDLVDRVEEACGRLASFPHLGVVPRWNVLARQGYRMLVVGRHLVFYKVDEDRERVVLYAVFDGRQEYWRYLG